MNRITPRDPRHLARLSAQLRKDHGWHDVIIGNVSARGIMLKCPHPPLRGTFIEVRHRGASVIGWVVWSKRDRCGVRTQDRADLVLLGASSNPKRVDASDRHMQISSRMRKLAIVELTENCRRISKLIDWVAIAAAGAMAAYLIADGVGAVFQSPINKVTEQLAGIRSS